MSAVPVFCEEYATIVADPPWRTMAGPLNGREGFGDATGASRPLPYALASPPSAPAPAASEWEIDHRADALANAVIAGTDHISNLTAALHTEQDRTHRYLARAEQAEAERDEARGRVAALDAIPAGHSFGHSPALPDRP